MTETDDDNGWLAHDIGFAAGLAAHRREMDRLRADHEATTRANNIRWERAMDDERAAWKEALNGYESLVLTTRETLAAAREALLIARELDGNEDRRHRIIDAALAALDQP